ncbi:tRNA pseudouridine(55) synthase TruB [Thermosulfuriphilus sp.]
MNGVLVVDKPEGMTSFKVVDLLKRKLKLRRAGHGGTLDPLATGVLPVCLGKATKLAQFILEGDKVYEGVMELGIETDTYDALGEVVARRQVPSLELGDLERVAANFVGLIEQSPPPYSAAKHKGRPLYEYARKGAPVIKPPKKVEVLEFKILSYEAPFVYFRVACGKGTYIRSLVHDLGQVLGCGACLKGLRRTKKGPFDISQAMGLKEILDKASVGELEEHLVPIPRALSFIPSVVIGEELARRIRHGFRPRVGMIWNLLRVQKVVRVPRIPWLRLMVNDDLVAVVMYPEPGDSGEIDLVRVFNP